MCTEGASMIERDILNYLRHCSGTVAYLLERETPVSTDSDSQAMTTAKAVERLNHVLEYHELDPFSEEALRFVLVHIERIQTADAKGE
jgi:hypothetical protein